MLGEAERELLEKLWREQAGPMRSFMLRWVGDVEVAEDAVAEVYWRACRAMAQGRSPRHNAKGWLWQILHNYRIDVARRRARAPVWIALEEARDYGLEANAGVAGSSADLEATEQQILLRAALERLPPRQAELVWLRHFEGFGLDEIAQARGMSYGAAKAVHHRALVGLRAHCGEG